MGKLRDSLSLCMVLTVGLTGCGTPGPAGPQGMAGEQGPPGTVTPNLIAVSPNGSFLGRKLRLQISGVGTHFTSSSTVDFGDAGITASEISAGNENNLSLTAQVGANARLGAHDVTVTSGNETVKLMGVFPVNAALQAEPVQSQPMVPQGGLYAFNLRNLDYREYPFLSPGPTLSPISQVATTVQASSLAGMALIDVLAPAGLLSLSGTQKSVFGEDIYYSTAPNDQSLAMVTTRPATVLTNNTARSGDSLPAKNATNLYKLTTTAASQLLVLTYSNLGAVLGTGTKRLITAVAPSSGKFREGSRLPWAFDMTTQTGLIITNLPTASDYYLATYADDYGGAATGYTYTITPKLNTLTQLSNSEPTSEAPATPSLKINSLNQAVIAKDGVISDKMDEDYLVFTAASSGTVLFQLTVLPSSAGSPAYVAYDVYSDSACTSQISQASATPENPSTNLIAITSGMTYCIRFTSPYLFPSAQASYTYLVAP